MPGKRAELERPDLTIYSVFSELLQETVEAHKQNDIDRLEKFYDFAEWCFRQKEEALWNAAGVSFYEHLGNYPETLAAMPEYVKRDIYKDIRGLLALSMESQELKKLDEKYGLR